MEKEDAMLIRIKDSMIGLKDKEGKDAKRYKELQKEFPESPSGFDTRGGKRRKKSKCES